MIIKKVLSRIIPRLKCIRGQVAVFYALMIPIFLFAGGAGLDLGWYYLNVSRLQNAADASVIVGARTLAADTTNFKDYAYSTLVEKFPASNQDYTKDITAGNQAAADYALKNLSSDTNSATGKSGNTYTIKDSYTRGDNTIRITPALYKDAKENYYYVVHMEEDIHHFFLGFLDDMNAGVVSVAKLSYNFISRPPGVIAEGGVPDGKSLLAAMYNTEDVSVMRNWEWQDYYKDKNAAYKQAIGRTAQDTEVNIYSGKWNEYQDKGGVHYKKGDKYRTETANVYSGSSSQGSSTGKVASHSEAEVDSLNLDFKAEIQFKKTWSSQHWEDFDILYSDPDAVNYVNGANKESANLRIHSTFNFATPYKKRTSDKYDTQKNPEDVLYVRIESEPIWELAFKKGHTHYSSVRQIIININESNMDKQYRPLMFFYAGAEKIDNDSDVRESQPIILNLNADARVIFFCPNTPIIINGNGHKMQGFVVAKEFRRLKTTKDYTSYLDENNNTVYEDSKNNKYYLKEDAYGTNDLIIDEYGNVQSELLDDDAIRDPEYVTLLREHNSDYREQLSSSKDSDKYLLNLLYGTSSGTTSVYSDCFEMPVRADVVRDWEQEKVYKLEAFNLKRLNSSDEVYYVEDENMNYSSYYDSFGLKDDSPELNAASSEYNEASSVSKISKDLRRKIYAYLDGKIFNPNAPSDSPYSLKYTDTNKKSVDMFFTTIRAGWID